MTNTISKFEHLPNELLLDIFLYCRPRDLFVSLFNLNQRLNNLISIQSLNIDLGNALPKYLLDLYYKSVLSNAKEQIHTLRLSDTYGRLRRFINKDENFDVDYVTRQAILSQVKHLVLWDPMMNSLHEILQQTENLQYFQVTSIGRARQTPNYSQGLLKRLFEFNSLKKLSLALHDSIVFTDEIGTNTSLTHLTLNGCHMQHLAPLLRRLPNIRRLNVMCYNRPNLFSVKAQNFDYSLYAGLADCVPHLTDLILHVTHTPFFEIEAFLRELPRLTRLSFSSLLVEDYSNGKKWERILLQLPHLQRFSLFINETHISSRFPIDIQRILESFSAPFWHRWPVVVEYCTESINRRHLMLYTLPIHRDSVRTYLYNVQTETTRDTFEFSSQSDQFDYKKLSELHFTLHANSPSETCLPSRNYNNLKSLSFSSQLTSMESHQADRICEDLKKICSTKALKNVKRIYLYDHVYPTNFLSKLLNFLPNVQSLRVSASIINIAVSLPNVTSLTVDFAMSIPCRTTDVLRQIGLYLPNIRYLYLELNAASEIYILLIYFLRKLVQLFDIHVTLHGNNARFDQTRFIEWFNEFKILDRLNSRAQVEFADENNRLHISL